MSSRWHLKRQDNDNDIVSSVGRRYVNSSSRRRFAVERIGYDISADFSCSRNYLKELVNAKLDAHS